MKVKLQDLASGDSFLHENVTYKVADVITAFEKNPSESGCVDTYIVCTNGTTFVVDLNYEYGGVFLVSQDDSFGKVIEIVKTSILTS